MTVPYRNRDAERAFRDFRTSHEEEGKYRQFRFHPEKGKDFDDYGNNNLESMHDSYIPPQYETQQREASQTHFTMLNLEDMGVPRSMDTHNPKSNFYGSGYSHPYDNPSNHPLGNWNSSYAATLDYQIQLLNRAKMQNQTIVILLVLIMTAVISTMVYSIIH